MLSEMRTADSARLSFHLVREIYQIFAVSFQICHIIQHFLPFFFVLFHESAKDFRVEFHLIVCIRKTFGSIHFHQTQFLQKSLFQFLFFCSFLPFSGQEFFRQILIDDLL